MADDIVTRLRCIYDPDGCEQCAFCLANAEIERLCGQLEEMAESLMRESGAGLFCASDSTPGVLSKYLRAVNG